MKTKFIDHKNRIECAESYNTVRKCVIRGISKFNCDLVYKALEDNNGLKSAKHKLCVGRKGTLALKMSDETITKNKDKILSIVIKTVTVYISVNIKEKAT